MILFTAQESSALPTLAETQAVAVEVHEDLQQLQPNAILESIKAWTPGLLSMVYRLFVAALIVFIGSRIAIYISHFLKKTFDRMGMDLSLSKFLISLANAITYAIVIFMALEKIGVPSASIRFRNFGYWPFPSGKSCKLCRRYPDPYYAAFRYS